LKCASGATRVAVVEDDKLRLAKADATLFQLAQQALATTIPLMTTIEGELSEERVDYDPIYNGKSDWHLLPPFMHPEPARFLVSGTGLTHKKSADTRQAMHHNQAELSDSMKMYLAGLEAGRPEPGAIGVPPEWFYKGNGHIVKAHGEPLTVPNFGGDGGEEPEIAGVYVVDQEGNPRRVGMTMANEFSDHIIEKQNYLYLAPSKLRECALGPEIVIDAAFDTVPGTVRIERQGAIFWEHAIASGEANMSHSLANLEHHHFKYPEHRRPGDAHIHFFGADAFSFGAGVQLLDGDRMIVSFEGYGRPLINPLRIDGSAQTFVAVSSL
jgi:hypothetical protein